MSTREILEFDVEGMTIMLSKKSQATIDEIGSAPAGVAVYVTGDVSHDSPPRKLNEKMLEHGYCYIDWVMNGKTGDNRAIFKYKNIEDEI